MDRYNVKYKRRRRQSDEIISKNMDCDTSEFALRELCCQHFDMTLSDFLNGRVIQERLNLFASLIYSMEIETWDDEHYSKWMSTLFTYAQRLDNLSKEMNVIHECLGRQRRIERYKNKQTKE